MEISSRKIAYTGDAPKDGRRLMRVGGLAMCGWLQRWWLAWSMWFWCGSVRRRRRYLPRCKLPHELAPTSRAAGFLTSFPTAPIHFIFFGFLKPSCYCSLIVARGGVQVRWPYLFCPPGCWKQARWATCSAAVFIYLFVLFLTIPVRPIC